MHGSWRSANHQPLQQQQQHTAHVAVQPRAAWSAARARALMPSQSPLSRRLHTYLPPQTAAINRRFASRQTTPSMWTPSLLVSTGGHNSAYTTPPAAPSSAFPRLVAASLCLPGRRALTQGRATPRGPRACESNQRRVQARTPTLCCQRGRALQTQTAMVRLATHAPCTTAPHALRAPPRRAPSAPMATSWTTQYVQVSACVRACVRACARGQLPAHQLRTRAAAITVETPAAPPLSPPCAPACVAAGCETCVPHKPTVCKVCNAGYTLSSGSCIGERLQASGSKAPKSRVTGPAAALTASAGTPSVCLCVSLDGQHNSYVCAGLVGCHGCRQGGCELELRLCNRSGVPRPAQPPLPQLPAPSCSRARQHCAQLQILHGQRSRRVPLLRAAVQEEWREVRLAFPMLRASPKRSRRPGVLKLLIPPHHPD